MNKHKCLLEYLISCNRVSLFLYEIVYIIICYYCVSCLPVCETVSCGVKQQINKNRTSVFAFLVC